MLYYNEWERTSVIASYRDHAHIPVAVARTPINLYHQASQILSHLLVIMKFKSEVKFKSMPLFLFLCLSLSNIMLSESVTVAPHNMEGQSKTYYVQPSSSSSCPTEPCFTIQQLANSTNNLKNSSIELIFLPGKHALNLELSIIGINTVSMHSNITNYFSGETVVINCNHSGKFKFKKVQAVSVINLTFIGCNGSKAMGVHQFVIEDSSFIGGAALEFILTSAMLVRSTFYRNSGKKSHYVTNLRNHSQVGGAIVATAKSNIIVIDSIFEENSAELGGAIFSNLGSHITIINTSFSENSINEYNVQGGYRSRDFERGGGVLYGDSGVTITIQDSQFTNNTAQGQLCGGVVFIVSNTVDYTVNSALTIENSQFINNSAQESGGAIYAHSYVNVTIISSYFKGITSQGEGGVICAYDNVIISIAKSRFINNIANYSKIIFGNSKVRITVTHSQFINNDASGIINIEINSYLKITHSVFTNNSAIEGTLVPHGSHLIVSRSYFINNCYRVKKYVTGSGGVVSAERNVNIALAHSYFEGCSNGASGELKNGRVVHIRAVLADGGISGYLNITYCQFINNMALAGGGALYLEANFFSSGYNLLIIGSKFSGNRASEGGSIYLNGGSLVIHNSTFNYNLAGSDGGALYIQNAAVKVTETEFSSNQANRNGGIMFLTGFQTKTYSANCSFFTNFAGGNGGLFYVTSGNLHLSGNLCQNNTADNDGGVLYTIESNINISESNIQHNYAMNDGGATRSYQSNITLSRSSFHSNVAMNDGGVSYMRQSDASIMECCFDGNNAINNGGVVNAYQGSLYISEDSIFIHNMADNDGGVIHAYQLSMTLTGNRYDYNKAWNRGGVWFIYQGQITVMQSIISHSEAVSSGVMYAYQGNITMRNVSCLRNNASDKGVIHTDQVSNMSIKFSSFSQNYVKKAKGGAWYMKKTQALFQTVSFSDNAAYHGGALYSSCCNISLINVIFKRNEAHSDGGAMYMKTTDLNISGLLLIHSNKAKIGVFYLIQSTAYFNGQTDIINNSGSFLILESNVTFLGITSFINGFELTELMEPKLKLNIREMELYNIKAKVQQGGALTTIKSIIILGGTCIIADNRADDGGAIHATESKIYVNGEIVVARNKASSNGGGVYLHTSELHFENNGFLHLSNNVANESGGGIHAIGSTIRISRSKSALELDKSQTTNVLGCSLCFTNNHADKGGGLYLDENAKIHLYYTDDFRSNIYPFAFVNNSANYGGGIYISDNPCGPIYNYQYIINRLNRPCFIQISAYCTSCSELSNITINGIFFLENNYALTSGPSLFGEMLDQCKTPLSQSSKLPAMDNQTCDRLNDTVNIISSIGHISNIELSDIGTEPYRLCFCQGSQFNCSLQHDDIKVRKTKRFSVELVAVDRVNHPVNATIYSHLARTGGRLLQGQEYQNTSKICTELVYNILFSPNDQEELILYPKNCIRSDSFQSQRKLTIKFTGCDSCPFGFEKHINDDTSCECVCDSELKQYIENCNASTEMLERKGNVWISYLNTGDNFTSGYLIYPYCPLNYCLSPTSKVEINLNIPHGADAQCADGHSGILCGSCRKNLSLSLGSSRCIPCSTHWPKMLAFLLGISLAGIALVIVLLMLNLTVAIGTLNGILFYANIVAANDNTYMPFSTPNFATIFISWLNLEIGFNACLFEGMNPFWKTLLQLAFPTYSIFLVLLIIIISEYSTKFAWLLAKKNPVATLATLILLSYTKYLNMIIATFSYVMLKYPDGSHRKLWRLDATVEYLRGKHIILFIVAALILIIGIAYTSLLLSWQWLHYYQYYKKFLKWTRYQKLCLFLEPYHAPYNLRHRYWTGLLLFARVLLYIISAVNITGDPHMPLVVTIILITALLLIGRFWADMLYKKRLLEVMEVIMYVNITVLASLTLWNIDDASENQTVFVYISVTITFVLTMSVIIFHIFYYTCLLSVVKSIALKFKSARHQVEDDIISNREYHQPLITYSVVELPKLAVDQASEEENELHVSTRSDDITTASDTACVQGLTDQES